MNIKSVFEKRIYSIEDGEDKYEVVHIGKHPIPDYSDSYFFHKYKEDENPENSGYWYFEPSDELKSIIIKTIESYE